MVLYVETDWAGSVGIAVRCEQREFRLSYSAVAVDEAINDNYRPHLRDRNVGERTRNVKLVLGNCDEDKFCTVFVASLSFKSKYAFELNSGHVN